jgi:magnesium transporter
MKTMTAMSIILLVPNLMAAIYGMNFKYMPELEKPNGYYVALSGMALAMALLAWNFKRKNWL